MRRIRTNFGELAILSAVAGFGLLLNRWAQTGGRGGAGWTADMAVLALGGGGLAFGILLLAGHLALRRAAILTGWAYAGVGAAAALAAFLCAGGIATIALAQAQGAVSLALILPLAAGAALGAIYHRMAGFEADPGADDPSRIETALALHRESGGQPAPAAAFPAPAPVLLEAGEERYFSGPMRVRSSLLLLLASGAAVGGIFSAIILLLGLATNLAQPGGSLGRSLPFDVDQGLGVSLGLVVGLCLLLLVPNFLAHKAAQKFKVLTVGGYSAAGFATCVAVGFLLPPFWILALPTAISMALYRRWAGVEPEPLPGEVFVSDPRALVGAHHPARAYRRVVSS